jgi:hypothetical protein
MAGGVLEGGGVTTGGGGGGGAPAWTCMGENKIVSAMEHDVMNCREIRRRVMDLFISVLSKISGFKFALTSLRHQQPACPL